MVFLCHITDAMPLTTVNQKKMCRSAFNIVKKIMLLTIDKTSLDLFCTLHCQWWTANKHLKKFLACFNPTKSSDACHILFFTMSCLFSCLNPLHGIVLGIGNTTQLFSFAICLPALLFSAALPLDFFFRFFFSSLFAFLMPLLCCFAVHCCRQSTQFGKKGENASLRDSQLFFQSSWGNQHEQLAS